VLDGDTRLDCALQPTCVALYTMFGVYAGELAVLSSPGLS